MDFANMDFANFVVAFLSLAVAVIVFVVTSAQTKKATEEQTKQENIRATLTDFAALRREHENFERLLQAHPDKRTELIKPYIADLERFAVGCNRGAYDLEVVNSMSGGMLVRQYRRYFRDYAGERRRATKLNSAVPRQNLYIEYETMMKSLCAMRGVTWEPIEMISEDQWVLERMLNMPISSPNSVFALFRTLPGAIESHGEGRQGYLFVPGTRKDRCVLVAHADTVFDTAYDHEPVEQTVVFEDGFYHGENSACSIGADDRAGCAMLWLLRKSGHSLLLLDGEEHGQIGSHFLKESNPELFAQINAHTFMVQLDRQGSSDYKTYQLRVPRGFTELVEHETGYALSESTGRTDIQVLCQDVSGVNLSVGFYDEHKPEERICLAEWENTLKVVRSMIAKPLKRYPLVK
ncbi:MAG: hypothetical protein Q4D34_03485, partial [Eggerthellaceae bacterium]|nr:hypothetical protein [Eggerthellaceae bacterium]